MVDIEQDRDPVAPYVVVLNDEGQYSIWPSRKSLPKGWRNVGKDGSKAECLKYVDKVWKDITPLSVRKNSQESSG